jgi:Spy/CpxP family protein refolding chaperone
VGRRRQRYAPLVLLERDGRIESRRAVWRADIIAKLARLQVESLELQWGRQAEQTTLREILERRPIDEAAAAAQLARPLDVEAEVKSKHLLSLVQIKNTLTDAQVVQLNQLLGRC